MLERDLVWEWKPNQFGYKAQLMLNLLNYGVIFSILCFLVTNARFWENSALISVGGSENGRKGKKLNLSLIFFFLWSFLHDIQSLNNQLKKIGYYMSNLLYKWDAPSCPDGYINSCTIGFLLVTRRFIKLDQCKKKKRKEIYICTHTLLQRLGFDSFFF